jgi:hypothetical protein
MTFKLSGEFILRNLAMISLLFVWNFEVLQLRVMSNEYLHDISACVTESC